MNRIGFGFLTSHTLLFTDHAADCNSLGPTIQPVSIQLTFHLSSPYFISYSMEGHGEENRHQKTEGKSKSLQSSEGTRRRTWETTGQSTAYLPAGKVMEQLTLDVISKQLEEKKFIRCSPHGFTKGNRGDQRSSFLGCPKWVNEG